MIVGHLRFSIYRQSEKTQDILVEFLVVMDLWKGQTERWAESAVNTLGVGKHEHSDRQYQTIKPPGYV